MLNLCQVNAFLAVVETGNFHAASCRLGIAQPTVSQRIKRLETALGAALLTRGHNQCAPTLRGQAFLPYARSLIAVAISTHARLAGRIIIGASSNVGIYSLQPHLKRIADQTRGLEFDLVIGPNMEIAEKLERSELDLAVMEWWDARAGFRARFWRRERLVIIVPPGHPWTDLLEISVSELLQVPLLGGERGTGTGTVLRKALGEAAARLRIERNLGSTEAVKQAVKAGLGVSLVSESAVADEVRHGSLIALSVADAQLFKELWVITPDHLPSGSTAANFSRVLLNDVANQALV